MKKSKVWIGIVLIVIVAAVLALRVLRGADSADPGYRTAVINRGMLKALVA